MNEFKLQAAYRPTGDQPQAIARLVEGVKAGYREQTLLGVTGSGKNFYYGADYSAIAASCSGYGT